MSAEVVDLVCPWQQAADASERARELMDDIPAPFEGFEHCPESAAELRRAAALLQEANTLLQRAEHREVPRFTAWEAAAEDDGTREVRQLRLAEPEEPQR